LGNRRGKKADHPPGKLTFVGHWGPRRDPRKKASKQARLEQGLKSKIKAQIHRCNRSRTNGPLNGKALRKQTKQRLK